MAHEIFGEAWARAWMEALNASAAYREAAARWEGAIVLALPTGPAAWADLHHGVCRAARAAADDDRSAAPIVIRGESATWQRLLTGDLDPIFALMGGKLKLERGSVAALLPFARAAKEMVAAAARVPTTVPSTDAPGSQMTGAKAPGSQ